MECQPVCAAVLSCAHACMSLSSLLRVYIILHTNSALPPGTSLLQAVRAFLLGLCFGFFPPSLLSSLSFAAYLSTAELSSSVLALLLALAVRRMEHPLQALLSLGVPGKWLVWAHNFLAALLLLALLLASSFTKFFLISPVQPSSRE